MSKKVHVVPHMHWDREWYFTTEESRILLVNNMEEIMDMLENNPNYPNYVLDGQTAILEDYFAAKPENKERVKKLVKEGRLIIGPWYTQTDEMVVGGESITRNLLYGLKDCEEFGDAMMIGYLPDSFGQSAQMPQILNGFGINRSIFWRGVSERMGTDKTEFYWEGEGDSKVLTQLFPLGYAIGKYLPSNMDDLKKRMDKYFPVLDKGATTENIILPNGHDQMPVQKNIFEILEKLKELYPERDFFLSRYEKVFEELEKEKNLPTLRGEFLDGKYMRVHRSIFSTRMDIKSANTRIENKITNILEPLASLAYSLGFEYHSGLIELIWKEIMKNHAHDSIGCCCSDKVHKEIMNRFFLAEEKVDRLIDFYMRVIVDAMSKDIALDKLTAFNLLPYEREAVVKGEIITKMKNFNLVSEDGEEYDFQVINKEVVDAGLIDRQIVHYGNYDPFVRYTIELKDVIPSMGYKTYLIKEAEGVISSEEGKKTDKVENKYFNITVNENGSLNILHKDTNTLYENVLLIEDGADDGDEYDFSPLEDDFIVKSDLVKCNYSISTYENSSEIAINYTLDVPKDLDSRNHKKIDGSMDISIIVKVDNCSPYLNVKMDIDNRAKDHRVRAYIPTGIKSNFSFSDNQFGVIKRDVYDSAMDVWEEENWDERPDSIYPMLSFVTLKNEERGMAVLTNSTREYEIIGEDYDTIAITLFRGVGFLGKEEMYRRPGRPSGIKLETPDSQMLEK
ncbi:MAG: mannosylglycerate hydrolase [Clostridium paraputrificum]